MAARLSHPWVTFSTLALLYFLASAGTFSSLGVVLPAMVRDLGWSWTQAGLGYTVLGVACGLSSLAPAVLIRRIGVRATLIVGAALLVAGFGALAMTRTVGVYLAATLLAGVGLTLTTTVPGAHVLTSLFRRRSTALGAYFTIGALGGVAGPLMYVAVEGPTHRWRLYWWVLVAGCALAGAFAAAAAPTGRQTRTAPEQAPEQLGPAALVEGLGDWTVRRALATPQFYVIVGAYTTYLLINTTAHGFTVEHLTERGIAPKVAAGVLSLEALVGAVVSVIGGVVGEKVRAKTLLVVSLVALVGGMAALAEARGYVLMLIYASGVGVGIGLTFLASTMLLLDYFGKRANLELYSLMCLISTSAAAGPAFGGWARDTLGGFAGVFLLCAATTLVMLIVTLFLAPPKLAAVAPARRAEAMAAGAARDPV